MSETMTARELEIRKTSRHFWTAGDAEYLLRQLDVEREETAALRKQAANLATALWECETARDDLADELRVRSEVE